MSESSYYILTHYRRLKPAKMQLHAQRLEQALRQLETYHDKAPSNKRPVIERLIAKYDEILCKLGLY